jgi:hypothetical protein
VGGGAPAGGGRLGGVPGAREVAAVAGHVGAASKGVSNMVLAAGAAAVGGVILGAGGKGWLGHSSSSGSNKKPDGPLSAAEDKERKKLKQVIKGGKATSEQLARFEILKARFRNNR